MYIQCVTLSGEYIGDRVHTMCQIVGEYIGVHNVCQIVGGI